MEDRLTLVEAVNREPGRIPIETFAPGSPGRKVAPGVSGPESRPGILHGVPCLEYFTGLIFPEPATSTPGYYITGANGNPLPAQDWLIVVGWGSAPR
jgi:hypothetical protein